MRSKKASLLASSFSDYRTVRAERTKHHQIQENTKNKASTRAFTICKT